MLTYQCHMQSIAGVGSLQPACGELLSAMPLLLKSFQQATDRVSGAIGTMLWSVPDQLQWVTAGVHNLMQKSHVPVNQ